MVTAAGIARHGIAGVASSRVGLHLGVVGMGVEVLVVRVVAGGGRGRVRAGGARLRTTVGCV